MKKTTSAIELQNIQTIYEGEKTPAIYDINLTVNSGEFLAIIGPNGAGKTTLIETINGVLPYTAGVGFVFGKEIPKNKTAIRKETGYIIQNLDIDPQTPFLCKDIVMSGRVGKIGLLRFATAEDWEKVWYCMGLVGMIDFADRPVGKLSGGELQKILFARALVQEPKLLLLDEPFSNLDISARNQMEILLNRIHKKYQMAILMVSHDLSFIPSRCKRVVVLDKGKTIIDGKKEKVLTSESLKNIFNKNEVKS